MEPPHMEPPPLQPPPLEPPRRAASWALVGLFVIAAVLFVREAKALLVPVAVSVVLAFVFAPWVRKMRRRGVPETLGAALVVLGLMGSVAPVALSLASPSAEWLERAPTTLSQLLAQFDRLRAAIPGLAPPGAAQNTAVKLRSAQRPAAAPVAAPDPVKERLASEGLALTGALLGRATVVAASAAATVILLYVLLITESWMLPRVVRAIPKRRWRAALLGSLQAAQRDIGHFVVTLSVINLMVGVATGLAMAALGLPNPLLWAVLAGVMNFVPYLGPFMNMGLLLLAGVLSFADVPSMLAPMMAYALIHAIESTMVSPWVVGRQLSLSTLSVFLSVMFWGWLWGIAGALIAVPMLIGLRALCRRVPRMRALSPYLEGQAPASVLLPDKPACRGPVAVPAAQGVDPPS